MSSNLVLFFYGGHGGGGAFFMGGGQNVGGEGYIKLCFFFTASFGHLLGTNCFCLEKIF